MNIKRILLTGDDGYYSIGIRLLIEALKDTYEICVAATKHQQSGVGGKLSLSEGGEWGETTMEGVPVFWVDGTPADVMECAQGYYTEPFDLLISGVNMGANASSAVISSGTYSAAVRGLGVQIAPRAVAISWDAPPEVWFKKHDEKEDLMPYVKHPGEMLRPLFDLILKNELWGVQLLNINIPQQQTKTVRFTKLLKDITRYYRYPKVLDRQTKRFSYQGEPFDVKETNLKYDSAAVSQGYISITPCAFDMTHFSTFEKLQNKVEVLAL